MKLGSADNVTIIAEVGAIHVGSYGNAKEESTLNLVAVRQS
jgi:hypothetical protein